MIGLADGTPDEACAMSQVCQDGMKVHPELANTGLSMGYVFLIGVALVLIGVYLLGRRNKA